MRDADILAGIFGAPKIRKPRKASGPKITTGASVTVLGHAGKVIGRDEKFANAWLVEIESAPLRSYSCDMIAIK